MSYSFTNRRRLGRAPSPPTWAWYEQIPYEDDESDNTSSADESCSEDDEDYRDADRASDSDHTSSNDAQPVTRAAGTAPATITANTAANTTSANNNEQVSNEKMDVDAEKDCDAVNRDADTYEAKKDIKGKQRATEPEVVDEAPKRRERRKKRREHTITLRPILTIQKSQGFVWNQVRFTCLATLPLLFLTQWCRLSQDLFVPPYIKDRCMYSVITQYAFL